MARNLPCGGKRPNQQREECKLDTENFSLQAKTPLNFPGFPDCLLPYYSQVLPSLSFLIWPSCINWGLPGSPQGTSSWRTWLPEQPSCPYLRPSSQGSHLVNHLHDPFCGLGQRLAHIPALPCLLPCGTPLLWAPTLICTSSSAFRGPDQEPPCPELLFSRCAADSCPLQLPHLPHLTPGPLEPLASSTTHKSPYTIWTSLLLSLGGALCPTWNSLPWSLQIPSRSPQLEAMPPSSAAHGYQLGLVGVLSTSVPTIQMSVSQPVWHSAKPLQDGAGPNPP